MRRWWILLWVLLASDVLAQPTTVNLETISPVPTGEWDFEGGKFHFPETIVASLPAAGTSGRIYVVTDTNGASCTVGSGTTRLICRDTGAAWEAIGSAGGGGGTECASAPCDLNVATTLNSQNICLQDGTNCPGVATPTPTATSTAATATPTPTATLTAVACPTDASGHLGGLYAAHPEACKALPATVTPWPTLTPFPTITTTPVVCAAGEALDRAHPEGCVVMPSPDGIGLTSLPPTPTPTLGLAQILAGPTTGESTPGPARWRAIWWEDIANPLATRTPDPTRTPDATRTPDPTITPVPCQTDASGHLGGVYAYPNGCKDLPATVTPWPTLTPFATVTATPIACATDASGHLGGLYAANPLACKALPATVTPVPTPTAPYLVAVQEGGVAVGNCDTLNLDGTGFDVSKASNTCTIAPSAQILTTSSSIQPSQLSRLGADDQFKTWGTDDDCGTGYDATLARWVVRCAPGGGSTSDRMFVDTSGNGGFGVAVRVGPTSAATPTPTSTAATPTPTVTPTTALTATPTVTATSTGATVTPTPVPSPTSHALVDGIAVDRTCWHEGFTGAIIANNPQFLGLGPYAGYAASSPGDTMRLVYPKTVEISDLQVESYQEMGWGRRTTVTFERTDLASCKAAHAGAAACTWASPSGTPYCSIDDTGTGTDLRCDTINTGLKLRVEGKSSSGPGQAIHVKISTAGSIANLVYSVSWMVCMGPPAYTPQ